MVDLAEQAVLQATSCHQHQTQLVKQININSLVLLSLTNPVTSFLYIVGQINVNKGYSVVYKQPSYFLLTCTKTDELKLLYLFLFCCLQLAQVLRSMYIVRHISQIKFCSIVYY